VRFSCLLIGNDNLTIQCGQRLLDGGHEIRAILSQRADVRNWGAAAGLTVADTADELAGQSADWLFSIAYTELIPDAVLALAKKGAVNFHDGPLPRYAGLNAPVWALLNGEASHGVTWHLIEGGVDEGDILAARHFDLEADDTALTVNAKCFAAAIDSFEDVLAAVTAPELSRQPQDLNQRSYVARKDKPFAGGMLDFARNSDEILRLVRALDHGAGYDNPVALPKLVLDGTTVLVRQAELVTGQGAPGTVLARDGDSLTVACGDGALRLSGLSDAMGATLAGDALGGDVAQSDLGAVDAAVKDVAGHEPSWTKRFEAYAPALWATEADGEGALTIPVPGASAVGFGAVATVLTGLDEVDLALASQGVSGAVLPWVPVRFESTTWGAENVSLSGQIEEFRAKGGCLACLPARLAGLEPRRMPMVALSESGPLAGAALTLDLGAGALHADLSRISEVEARLIAARLVHLGEVAPADETAIADLPLVPEAEREMLLTDWNATAKDYPEDTCIHQVFEAQVAKTPEAAALVFEHRSYSYAELDVAANRVANRLIEMGVRPNAPVGLCVTRSDALVIGALGILKAGGAYLPLDPAYPADRIALYVSDSGASVIVTEGALISDLPVGDYEKLALDAMGGGADARPETDVTSADLAYLIYTSGSTGTPKGVMVEHRNVANFFTGMDGRVNHDAGSVWLALTSLSFDISVLELFWTLGRGFKVVVSGDQLMIAGTGGQARKKVDFSLYYWGNDDGYGRDKYALMLDGACFADEHGFSAVWTPERHFHAFGGQYPNPSVTGAAIAAVTKNIGVRAGSCVGPLHHVARIAEEWAVVDNLTDGKAGLAIASGWQPDDFVLRPENAPPHNKPAMFDTIRDLRKLWSGEAVEFEKADGSKVACLTQPRPVSEKPDIWVTTAGNPETWKQAGENGAHILTHLLGQSIPEVGEKIKLYHAALREAGYDPDDFTVTLMLHTYLAEDRETARRVAEEPMKDYLRSAADLIRQYAWAFPAFKKPEGMESHRALDLSALEADELEAIMDFAFARYFEDSGLFGTVEDAMARVEEVTAIGVTEVACLIDYGIERATVLEGLKPLAEVLKRVNEGAGEGPGEDDYSVAAQIARHGATHLQCTPSMARMLLTNDEARAALKHLKHILIGGEALPGSLVEELGSVTDAHIENMYGPTETTIWSTTAAAQGDQAVNGIGTPIANTQVYVLDEARRPCPVGVAGELYIGGAGVTRGYWQRDELTAERFPENPFRPGERVFATGDLARWRADGSLDFLGRNDHQVKLRGYRIELGEIEACMEELASVDQAVVLLREDVPGVKQLVGYVKGTADDTALRSALAAQLPAFMVPARFVRMDDFPLTPNKKIDRNALSAPGAEAAKAPVKPAKSAALPKAGGDPSTVAPVIEAIWCRLLGLAAIKPSENFFELGGHSLLAVEAHRDIRDALGLKALSIADFFRFPTLGGLSSHAVSLMGAAAPEMPTTPEVGDAAVTDKRRAMRRMRSSA